MLTCGPEEMRDLEKAHHWYQRSAAAGCPEGCLGYALSLAPRTQDEAGRHEVAEHLRRATEAELPTAIYLLAVLTEQGVGVARDPVVAAQPGLSEDEVLHDVAPSTSASPQRGCAER